MDRNQQTDLLKALAAALETCNDAGEPAEHAIGHFTLGPVDGAGEPSAVGYLTASGLIEAIEKLGADTPNTPEDDAFDAHIRRMMAGAGPQLNNEISGFLRSLDDAALQSVTDFHIEHADLADQLTKVFQGIDPRAMTATVLDQPGVDKVRTLEALDDVFGATADPYDAYMDADGLGEDGE